MKQVLPRGNGGCCDEEQPGSSLREKMRVVVVVQWE